jgi:hypothetical protein
MLTSNEDNQTWEEFAAKLPRSASDTDRLMAAVYYRVQVEANNSFVIAEIVNEYFRRARWPRPTNLSATANYCASRGWLSEVGREKNRKVWKLTRTGHAAVSPRLKDAEEV